MKNIGEYAFELARNLKRVFLHEGTKQVGKAAFSQSGITEIEIPRSIAFIPDMTFDGCDELHTVKLPETILRIGANAFSHCKSLININLPQFLRELDHNAFEGCLSLSSVCIPEGVEHIGREVFWKCEKLMELTVLTDKIERCDILWMCSSIRYIYTPSQALAQKLFSDNDYVCAIRGFITKYHERKTTEEEVDGWVAYISGHMLKCVENLGEEILFWRFVTEREMISAESVRTYVNLVSSIECRALLFNYLNECGEVDRDGGV